MLRAVGPEARLDITCLTATPDAATALTALTALTATTTTYDVGGLLISSPSDPFLNRTLLRSATANTSAFKYTGHRVEAPSAPYAWTPGARHSDPEAAWPPLGTVRNEWKGRRVKRRKERPGVWLYIILGCIIPNGRRLYRLEYAP